MHPAYTREARNAPPLLRLVHQALLCLLGLCGQSLGSLDLRRLASLLGRRNAFGLRGLWHVGSPCVGARRAGATAWKIRRAPYV